MHNAALQLQAQRRTAGDPGLPDYVMHGLLQVDLAQVFDIAGKKLLA